MGKYVGRKTGVAAFVVLVALSIHRSRSVELKSPVLEIPHGKLEGVVSYTRSGKEIYEYLRIPYAKPPEGQLRFESPEPAANWEGVRDASEVGPQCMQMNFLTDAVDGSEDCLFLNVYTPKERNGLLPVMVWIHGGAFLFGTANGYRPAYLLDENVVLVTINYRLAALGFLNTGDGKIRGNMGLKDQTMALKWVQNSIERFGGDPKKVTLFGESAGSASVGFHLLSPMSKGLFSRAIMLSGSPLANWALYREPAKQAKRFAAKFNCSDSDKSEIATCLKKVDATTLVKAHKESLHPLRERITLFVPTIETVQDKNTFMGEEPIESLTSGRFNKVPVIVGVNRDEGLLQSSIITANQTKLKQANNDWNFFAPRILDYDPGNVDASNKIRKFYFGDTENIATIDVIANYTNMFSDVMFFVPAHRFVVPYMKHAQVRLYLYSYQAEFSLADILAATQSERLPVMASLVIDMLKRWAYKKIYGEDLPHLGVCHSDELQLLFEWPLSAFITKDHKDYEMSKKMVKMWGDFAHNKESISIEDISWAVLNPKSSKKLQYLNINLKPKMEDEPLFERIEFWKSIGL